MKKLSGIMLAFLLAIGIYVCEVNLTEVYAAEEYSMGDGIVATLSDDGKTLTVSGQGTIKDFYDWGIGEYTDDPIFLRNDSIENLEIKNGITSIGAGAFSGMKALKSVRCAGSVVKIEEFAFYGDKSLNKVVLSENLTYLGDYAFSGNYYSTGEEYTGSSSLKLESISFTNGNDYTGCDGTHPDCTGLTHFGIDVFANSGIATQYWLEKEKTDGDVMEKGCVYFDKAVIYSSQKMESITVKDGTTVIAPGAFKMLNFEDNGSVLKEVSIPDSVQYIGNAAFGNCHALASVKLPEGLKKISTSAFNNCTSLTSVALPAGITEIPAYAFSGCTKLAEVTIPENVTVIDQSAFEGCTALKSVTIPSESKLKSILQNAFKGCISLSSISFPKTLSLIGISAFEGAGLTGVTYTNAGGTIGTRAFADCANLTEVILSCGLTKPNNGSDGSNIDQFAGCNNIRTVTFIGTKEQWENYELYGLSTVTPDLQECEHNYVLDSNNSRSATCELPGYTVYTCAICSDSYSTEISATGHSYTAWKTVKPTYAAGGYDYRICQVCGEGKEYRNDTAKLTLASPAITKLTAGKKTLTVKWKKKAYTGYQVQIARNSRFTSGKKTYAVKSYKTLSKTVTKLTSKKKYYVRVRAYKTYNKKTYYSGWSKANNIKVK